ncbi:hypothetical protein [Novosphingobium malaysiense]|uniref:Uncharacterized protein n=1 Tax=Novosphingobium malaysiense TaxID=1348853 RepID=A0A0B1ZTY2_9SPHN|nr:hypothetical protein [Novosphingobium malaysiense]KHK92588.1 hypothetical protein LK12_07405 [Novosphingobium malaysiense]
MSLIRKTVLAGTLAATALVTTAVTATPAAARDYHRGGDDTAAVAIGAGVIGLALGAIIASSNNDHDRYRDRYYDRGYAYGPAYTSGWYYRDGYYWDRDGRRHSRAEYGRRHRDYRHHNARRDRDYDRHYDRRDWRRDR